MTKKFKVGFPSCSHYGLTMGFKGDVLLEPTKTQGNCPIHDYMCPDCGCGTGSYYGCGCSEMRQRYFKLWGVN